MPHNEEIDPEIREYYQRLALEQLLQRKSRINPTTSQLEYWSQPPGFPGIGSPQDFVVVANRIKNASVYQ